MAVIIDDGMEALPCAAEAIKRGYLYKLDASYNMTKTASVTDVVAGVAAESSVDADGNAKTLVAGDKINFFIPGNGRKVQVASLNAQTWRRGAAVYTSQTAETNGLAGTSSENSAVKVGHYYGPDNLLTTEDGQLIDVRLNVPNGGT